MKILIFSHSFENFCTKRETQFKASNWHDDIGDNFSHQEKDKASSLKVNLKSILPQYFL